MCVTDVSTLLQAPSWRGSIALPRRHWRCLQPATTICGPTGGLQASSRLLHWSIRPTGFFPGGYGEQLFWATTAPSSSWACPPTQNQNAAAAVDRRYVYFGGRWGISCYRGANVWGFLPSIAGSIRSQSMSVPCCWRVDGLEAVLGSHCCGGGGRGRMRWGRQKGDFCPPQLLRLDHPVLSTIAWFGQEYVCAWQASLRDALVLHSLRKRPSLAERSMILSLSSDELSWLLLTREGHILPPLVQQSWGLPLVSLCPIEFQQKGIWIVSGGKPAGMGGPSREAGQGEEAPAQPSCQNMWTSNNLALWRVYEEGQR